MSENKILIEVFDGITRGWCSCSSGGRPNDNCGANAEESYLEMKNTLMESYGETIEVNYLDTGKPGFPGYRYPLIERVIQVGYAFPVIAINGKPRMAGVIDLVQIRKILDEIIGTN